MSSKSSGAASGKPKGPRWWPAAVLLGLLAIALAWIWLTGEETRQGRVMLTAAAVVIGSLLLLVWLLLLSRLRFRVRLFSLALLLSGGLLASQLFRVTGVTGDVVPILEWRWPSGDEPESAGSPVLSPEPPSLTGLQDYPQFYGPNRDAVLPSLNLATDWTEKPPRLLWGHPVGEGWSSFAVRGDWAVTQEQHGEEERVVAYSVRSGQVRWIHADRARYQTTIAGVGPRSTPTIVDGRVYTMGATGLLNCLDLATGSRQWGRDVIRENGASVPVWGKSCSPLVLDGLVIVTAGGSDGRSLVAYDKTTGRQIWQGGSVASSYSSPQLHTLADIPQIVILNHSNLAAHSPTNGEVLWEHPWPSDQPNVSQPLRLPGDRLLASAGYGVGTKLFQISATDKGTLQAELLWESPRLKAKFTNLVFQRGYVYGLDDGVLVCLDPSNGQRRWKKGRYGHGQIILVGDLLLLQTEQGEVVLLEPNPQELKELTRFPALQGKTWNPPALAGRYLLVRNHREAACYELPVTN